MEKKETLSVSGRQQLAKSEAQGYFEDGQDRYSIPLGVIDSGAWLIGFLTLFPPAPFRAAKVSEIPENTDPFLRRHYLNREVHGSVLDLRVPF